MKLSKKLFAFLISSFLLLSFSVTGCFSSSSDDDDQMDDFTWRSFSTGYTAATNETAAYLHQRLPRQYDYARTTGGYWGINPENGKDVFIGGDIDGVYEAVLAGYTSEAFRDTSGGDISAYNMSQFITESWVRSKTPQPAGATLSASADARDLYAYNVYAANDGWSWRDAISASRYAFDLIWDGEFNATYIGALNNNARLLFKPTYADYGHPVYGNTGTATQSYNFRNTSWAEFVFAFRKIDVQIGNTLLPSRTNLVRFEIGATAERSFINTNRTFTYIVETTVTIDGTSETVIKVGNDNFLTPYVTTNQGAVTDYKIYSVDGSYQTYSTEDITNAYYVPGKEYFCVVTGGISSKKVFYPVRIVINCAGNTVDGTKPVPALAAPYK